jgi:hypothetical protein
MGGRINAIRVGAKLCKLIGPYSQPPVSLGKQHGPLGIFFAQQRVIENAFVSQHDDTDAAQLRLIDGGEQTLVIAGNEHRFASLTLRQATEIAFQELPGFFTFVCRANDLLVNQLPIGTIGVPIKPAQAQIKTRTPRQPAQNPQKISAGDRGLRPGLTVAINQPCGEAIIDEGDA